MFNPEKILGELLMGGSRRRSGLGTLISSGAALGLAGVAMDEFAVQIEKCDHRCGTHTVFLERKILLLDTLAVEIGNL